MSGSSEGDTYCWGVAATGGIARGFVDDLALVDRAQVLAVGSRTVERADEFADEHGIERRYGSYEAMAEDPDVDIVYVASPHSRHMHDTVLFLEAGKHVLCEKPFALNAHEAGTMIDAARAADCFLMEALWSRFLPAYVVLRDLLDSEELGVPLSLDASFGFRLPVDPQHRLFDRALGGGALLDLGVYPLQLARLVCGAPDDVVARAHIGETKVDDHVVAVLHHADGAIATGTASLRANLPCDARIAFTDGAVHLPMVMHCPDHLTVTRGFTAERVDASHEGNGLRFQAEEVHRCLDAGARESPVMPLAETFALAETMDAIREQIGVRYDADTSSAEQVSEQGVDPRHRAP